MYSVENWTIMPIDLYRSCDVIKSIAWCIHLKFPDTDNQRVIIHVKDVNDEPPYFINRPLPMQTVVQLNAPANTPVFTLQARDPDTDHNIHYFIIRDRTGGRFEVDERSGVVRTKGTEAFQLDMEYVLYVKAEDQVNMFSWHLRSIRSNFEVLDSHI